MTATCHTSKHSRYVDLVAEEIGMLAGTIAEADPAAPVPTCPGWSVQQLAEHVGGVHRWAAKIVATLSPVVVRGREVVLETPEDPKDLPAWLEKGAGIVTAALRDADPDATVWAWGSDPHVRFWSRRMVYETLIHRADAASALGGRPEFDVALALDGIDEFLDNLPFAASFAPRVNELRGSGESICLRCGDARWTITLEPETFRWSHDDASADVTVEADAMSLLLFAWGRVKPAEVSVTGRRDVLDFWVERSAI